MRAHKSPPVCHVQIQEQRPASRILGCLLRVCRVRRVMAISGIILCTYITFHLIIHKPSIMIGINVATNGSSSVSGRRTAKDMPGYFMAGKYPYNNTFCKFNYGLPNKLDWNTISLEGSPEFGMKSPYRVIYNAIERTMLDSSYTAGKVTYATHVTPEYIYHIIEIARFWDGPISVAAFVPNYDVDITMRLFVQLCKCFEGMSKVSLHLVFPMGEPPLFVTEESTKSPFAVNNVTQSRDEKDFNFEMNNGSSTERSELDIDHKENVVTEEIKYEQKNKENANDLAGSVTIRQNYKYQSIINIDFKDCSNPDMSRTRTFRLQYGLIYPINVCRNVARNASATEYNLVSDVELIPSDGLATRFTVMLKKHKVHEKKEQLAKWKLAFVIPIFEIDFGEDVPRNKASLQQLYADGKAVYFHRWVCTHCQKIPDLQTWLKDDPGSVMKPFIVTKRQFPYHRWEPIYIGTQTTPWYSETLSWEGKQDKMTQMLEMCLKSYDFVVMDGAFLCHSPGMKTETKKKRNLFRYKHEQDNIKNYDQIVKKLASRYPPNIKCRI